jgi:hypothetical protein
MPDRNKNKLATTLRFRWCRVFADRGRNADVMDHFARSQASSSFRNCRGLHLRFRPPPCQARNAPHRGRVSSRPEFRHGRLPALKARTKDRICRRSLTASTLPKPALPDPPECPLVGTIQECEFVLADTRVVALHIGIMANMTSCGGLKGGKIDAGRIRSLCDPQGTRGGFSRQPRALRRVQPRSE